MIPNLFIAGFQKCGSSTLFHLLSQHPLIYGSSPKETFAITDATYEHYNYSCSIHNPVFDWNKYFIEQNEARFYMEASVCNFYQDSALEYIKSLSDRKVIFIVRNPIERFVSTYYYYGGSGVHLKANITLDEYYNLVLKGDSSLGKEAMRHALEHGKYKRYIEKWMNALGEKNIMVVGFKQIIQNPIKTCNQIFDFLNIEKLEQLELSHKNKTLVSRAPGLNRLLVNVLGGKKLVPSFVKDFYGRIMVKPIKKERLSESISKELELLYEAEFMQFKHLF